MHHFLQSEIFLITLSFTVYYLAQLLQQKLKLIILNPILVAVTFLILILRICKIDFSYYHENVKLIEFFLKPAVVALGVPLYQQLSKIRKQAIPIIISQLAGCIAGVVSVVLIAKWMGAGRDVILSLAPKSVTTPIAMEVSAVIGGIPSLTAAAVIAVGIFGSICGYTIMKWVQIKNPISQGISMGTAAHGIGTARSLEISSTFGAYSSLGLIVNGIFTSMLTPYIIKVLEIWIKF